MEKDPNSVNANATGEVKLKVTPDRAAVFVDGNYAGYVHQFGGVKRAMLIAPGKHHIKIALPGYRDFETEITVQANQKVTVKTATDACKHHGRSSRIEVDTGKSAVTSVGDGLATAARTCYNGRWPGRKIPACVPGQLPAGENYQPYGSSYPV